MPTYYCRGDNGGYDDDFRFYKSITYTIKHEKSLRNFHQYDYLHDHHLDQNVRIFSAFPKVSYNFSWSKSCTHAHTHITTITITNTDNHYSNSTELSSIFALHINGTMQNMVGTWLLLVSVTFIHIAASTYSLLL